MPKRKATRALVAMAPRNVAHRFGTANDPVVVESIHRADALRPKSIGPWTREADRIAWTDQATGYRCILLRSPQGGHLCGYVAVGRDHPFFGRSQRSLVGSGLETHHGIVHADACQAGGRLGTSVCHVVERATASGRMARTCASADGGDEAWWLGFSCDQPGDIVPDRPSSPREAAFLAGVVEPTYKDEAFVHRECGRLAVQLKAVENGLDPREHDPGPARPGPGEDDGRRSRPWAG